MEKHTCKIENAEKVYRWIKERGGVAVWKSINLSNPSASWSTPAKTDTGEDYPKPTWQAENKPNRIITDANEIEVLVPREIKRLHVAVRLGSQGLALKLTDGSTRRVEKAVEGAEQKYGHAWYEFDYETQDAVICVSDRSISLAEYAKEMNWE